jgi:hypothetical protein
MISLNNIIPTLNFLNLSACSNNSCSSSHFAFTKLSGNKYFRKRSLVNYLDLLTHDYHCKELVQMKNMVDSGKYHGLAGQALGLILLEVEEPVLNAHYLTHKRKVEKQFGEFIATSIKKSNRNFQNGLGLTRFIDDSSLHLYTQAMNSVFDSGYSYLQLKKEYDEHLNFLENPDIF